MSTRIKALVLAPGVLAAAISSPALAQHGGGHATGGGGHVGGGAHFGGGGHAGAAQGAPSAHVGGHFAAPGRVGGYHGAIGAGYARGYPGGYHGAVGAGYAHGYPGAYHSAGVGHGAYGRPGFYGHGYSTGAYWRGGYWHGGFWPRSYYGLGFAWFLPALPLAYNTYWYGGVPYYYANDVYYTYSPDYEGYVATDPPPAADSSGGDVAAAPAAPPSDSVPPTGSVPGQVFMYPKNGQSTEQQTKDRTECQQWAMSQAGQVAQNGGDYRRAMMACVEGRGYSAQ